MKTVIKLFACLFALAGIVAHSSAAVITEGVVQAELDLVKAASVPGYTIAPGFILSNGLPNTGAMGGTWAVEPTNTARLSNSVVFGPIIVQEPGGPLSVMFTGEGTNALVTYTTNQQSGGTNLFMCQTPTSLGANLATLGGINPHYSVEVWAETPVLSGGPPTMVFWGTSSASSNELAFNYGSSDSASGALNQGNQNFNWGPAGAPAGGVYHHLVVTYDGTTTSLYADGVLVNSTVSLNNSGTSFAPATNTPIVIGKTHNAGGPQGQSARMHIARVRVMDGVLTPSDVANNYATEAPSFGLTATTLAHAPIHRYQFWNHSAGNVNGSAVVSDTGTFANANATVLATSSGSRSMASFTGSALHLEGGAETNGAWVDLGTNLISSMSTYATNNGVTPGLPGYNFTPGTGTGQVTVEGWLTIKGHPNFWQTYFAFGASTATNSTNAAIGITTNVFASKIYGISMYGQSGGGGLNNGSANDGQLTANANGQGSINMWLLQQNNTDSDTLKMDLNGNTDYYYGGYSNGIPTPNHDDAFVGGYSVNQRLPFSMTYYACSWDEASGLIATYVNGIQVDLNQTYMKMFHLYERNDWLGRDFYHANSTTEGDYQEFRVYSNILSPAEVLGNYQVGSHVVNTAALGNATAIHIVRTTSSHSWVGSTAYFTIQADYASVSGVDVLPDNGLTLTVDDPTVISLSRGMLKFLKPGTTTVHASLAGSPARTDALTITVSPLSATMTHRYSFDPSFSGFAPYDSITTQYPPGNYGYVGAASQQASPYSMTDGVCIITNGLNNGGNPGWLDFGPNFIDPNYDALTVELWASFGAVGTTGPMFSFGDQRVNPGNILVAAPNGNGAPNGAFAMRGRYFLEADSFPNVLVNYSADDPGLGSGGGGGGAITYNFTRTGALNNLTNVHVVVEYNPTGGFDRLYVNGVPQTATNITLPLAKALVDNYNYVGLSVNSGWNDAGLLAPGVFGTLTPVATATLIGGTEGFQNMVLDEFRTYSGVLPQSNVVIDLATGPNLIVTSPGVLHTITLSTPSGLLQGQSAQMSLNGTFDNVTNVNMFLFDTNSTVLLYDPLLPLQPLTNNTIAAQVNTTGTLKANTPGGNVSLTNYVVATYPGFPTVSNLVVIFTVTPVLTHEWSFTTNTAPSGPTNSPLTGTWDTVAGALNATNFNYAYETNGSLVLTSNTLDFVQLPTQIIDSSYVTLTVEYWASFTNAGGTNANYADVWGFGDINFTTGFGRFYISMSEQGANNILTRINPNDPTSGGQGEINASVGGTLDGKVSQHVVSVYHPFGGYEELFTNGILAATNTLTTVSPTALQLLNDQYSYLGKPLYQTSPFLNATIDEFRIYRGVMTPLQVWVDYVSGPNTIINLNGGGPSPIGYLTNISLSVPSTTMIADQSEQAGLTATFTNLANPGPVFSYVAALIQSGFAATYPTLTSANSNVIQIVNSNIVAVGIGSTTVSASWSNKNATAVTITVVADPGNVAVTHRWPFNETNGDTIAHDVVGGSAFNGTLKGLDSFDGAGHLINPSANPLGAGPGTNFVYISSNQMISVLSNMTLELWVQGLDQTQYTRLLDFGETGDSNNIVGLTNQGVGNGIDYFMVAGNYGNTGVSARFKAVGATYTYDNNLVGSVGTATIIPTNFQTYYAVVYNASAGVASLYTNGVLLATGAIVDQLTNLHEYSNYFGKSHWGDPNVGAIYDEIRISTNAKTRAEIVAQKNAGPNAIGGIPVSISNSPAGGGKLRLTWPVWGTRYGVIQSSPSLTSPVWTPIGGSPTLATNASGTNNLLNIVNYQDVTPGVGNTFYIIK